MRSLFSLRINHERGTVTHEIRDASTYRVMEMIVLDRENRYSEGDQVLVADVRMIVA